MKIDFSHLFLGDSYTGWIPVGIKLASDPQTSARGGGRNQVHNHLVADQGLAAPILTDEREEPVFDLVPLAGSGRKMRNGKLQLPLVRQSLQLPLPQSQSSSVAASRISGNEQALCLGIDSSAHRVPPAPNALYRKSGGVVIHANIDPAAVLRQVIDAVRSDLPQGANFKIMHANLFGLSLRAPFAASVLKVAHQLLLLGIHRNHRLPARQVLLHFLVEVPKLSVAIGMLRTFQGLAIRLQTIPQGLQPGGHRLMAGGVPLPFQFRRQPANALARPAQRRFGVSSRHRFHLAAPDPLPKWGPSPGSLSALLQGDEPVAPVPA